MSTEPSYLPLLRKIAEAESNAESYLSAWAATTPRDDVRRTIATVALREGEHALAFQKRICELGYDVTIEQAAVTAEKVETASRTDLSDCEKFAKLGLGAAPDPAEKDRWTTYFDDSTIDIHTGELLGRFISEERDSVRMLADCCAALNAETNGSGTPTNTEARLDRIEGLIEKLVAKAG